MIEVGHDSMKLQNRVRLFGPWVKSAEARLHAMTDNKLDRGYRLRTLAENDWIEISANSHQALRTALLELKHAGFINTIYGHDWSIIPTNKRLYNGV